MDGDRCCVAMLLLVSPANSASECSGRRWERRSVPPNGFGTLHDCNCCQPQRLLHLPAALLLHAMAWRGSAAPSQAAVVVILSLSFRKMSSSSSLAGCLSLHSVASSSSPCLRAAAASGCVAASIQGKRPLGAALPALHGVKTRCEPPGVEFTMTLNGYMAESQPGHSGCSEPDHVSVWPSRWQDNN